LLNSDDCTKRKGKRKRKREREKKERKEREREREREEERYFFALFFPRGGLVPPSSDTP